MEWFCQYYKQKYKRLKSTKRLQHIISGVIIIITGLMEEEEKTLSQALCLNE